MFCLWSIYPDRNYEAKIGDDVDAKDRILPEVKNLCAEDVSDEGDANRTNDQESGMPCRKRVAGIVDRDDRLDQCTHEKDAQRISGLPRHGRRPPVVVNDKEFLIVDKTYPV